MSSHGWIPSHDFFTFPVPFANPKTSQLQSRYFGHTIHQPISNDEIEVTTASPKLIPSKNDSSVWDTTGLLKVTSHAPSLQNKIVQASPDCHQPLDSGKRGTDDPHISSSIPEFHDEDISFSDEHHVQSNRKRCKRRAVKKEMKSHALDEQSTEDQSASASPPKKKRRPRRTRQQKSPIGPASKPAKSSNRQPSRLVRKKPIGRAVPKTLDEATDPDKMMWKWKNAGKNWDEIRKEWQRMTGYLPGHSTLSVRYIKLNENLARNGAANDQDLCRFKKEAEEELMAQLWDRVAGKMLAHNPGSEHNPKELSRRYDMLIRTGFDLDEMARLEKESDLVSIPDIRSRMINTKPFAAELVDGLEDDAKIIMPDCTPNVAFHELNHSSRTYGKPGAHDVVLLNSLEKFGGHEEEIVTTPLLAGVTTSSNTENSFQAKAIGPLVIYDSDSD